MFRYRFVEGIVYLGIIILFKGYLEFVRVKERLMMFGGFFLLADFMKNLLIKIEV